MALNVLIIDDSKTVRAMIAKTLRLTGLDLGTLFTAEHGIAGLEILQRERVDLVLTDIHMPVMGGLQFLEEMRVREALCGIPVIVVSTEGSDERLADLKAKGVSFLRKPFSPEGLIKTVHSVLEAGHG